MKSTDLNGAMLQGVGMRTINFHVATIDLLDFAQQSASSYTTLASNSYKYTAKMDPISTFCRNILQRKEKTYS